MSRSSTTRRPLNDPIQDFRETLRRYTLHTHRHACGRPYIRVEKLKEWWKSAPANPEQGKTQLVRLLEHVYRNVPGYTFMKPKASTVLGDKHKPPSLLIFSILLDIGRGDLVKSFAHGDKFDKDLPLDQHILDKHFYELAKDDKRVQDPGDLAARFFEAQWKFCPMKLEIREFRKVDKSSVIPINRKKRITDSGGTAVLWQIEVLSEFVSAELQQAARNSEYTPDPDTDNLGARYHFALKEYKDNNSAENCQNELECFSAVEKHGGMVKFFGAYSQDRHYPVENAESVIRDPTSPTTAHYLLLEYGKRDVWTFLHQQLPPVMPEEIETFWDNMFEVATTLKGFHNFTNIHNDVVRRYAGFHCDVKLQNILEIDGKYKLADPGFAVFTEISGNNPPEIPKSMVRGFTRVYAAPELTQYNNRLGLVDQTIDIWALGCAFSSAATWLVLGGQANKQFWSFRKEATTKRKRVSSDSSQVEVGAYFHDGVRVLDEVRVWHDYIRGAIRGTDKVTGEVLDVVDKFMLVGDRRQRINSTHLCEKLTAISAKAKSLRPNVDEQVAVFLQQQDALIPEDAPSSSTITPAFIRSQSTLDDRQEIKSKIENAPLRPTAHRVRRGSHQEVSSGNGRLQLPIKTDAIVETMERDKGPKLNLALHLSEQLRHDYRESSSATQITAVHASPMHQRETVDQAYDLLMEGQSHRRKISSIFSTDFLRRARQQDKYLAQYYSQRDIIYLVDNATSMMQHWTLLKKTIKVLLKKSDGLDENGIDLYFTRGRQNLRNQVNINAVMSKLETPPLEGVYSNAAHSLNDIFRDFQTRVEKAARMHSQSYRKATVLFLTDGLWSKQTQRHEVSDIIENFVDFLRNKPGISEEHSFSIEFIQFGDDDGVTELFEWLDEGVPNIAKIVDTEKAATGDVYKMLLGSFVHEYDIADASSATTSPSRLSREDSNTTTPSRIELSKADFEQSGAQFSEPSTSAGRATRDTGGSVKRRGTDGSSLDVPAPHTSSRFGNLTRKLSFGKKPS